MRLILVTGKGGVGKTTIASATALRAASLGHRVLLTSTDRAHSLGDALLDDGVGHEPRQVAPRCWARELSVPTAARQSWDQIVGYLQTVLQSSGACPLDAEELAIVPGAEELLALSDLRSTLAGNDYDVVVVDCAPSAETLRLLNVPHLLQIVAERFGLRRTGAQLLSRVVASSLDLPSPDRQTVGAIDELERHVVGLADLLAIPGQTTARLVTTPERVVVRESLRTYTYLSLFGYATDAVVVNRLVPTSEDALLAAVGARQRQQLDEIDAAFGDLRIMTAPLLGDEPLGAERLAALGEQLYLDDPTTSLSPPRPLTITLDGDQRILSLPVTGHGIHDIALRRERDDIHVTVGDRSRLIALPDSLRHREVVDAGLRRGRLEMVFGAAS